MLPPYAEHYRNRLGEIEKELREEPPTAPTVVFLGDSLTETHPTREICGYRVINQGISGDEVRHSAGGMLRRLHLLPPARPAFVFAMVGINDLVTAGKEPETIMADHADLIFRVRRQVPHATFFMQSVLPTRDTFYKHNEPIRLINESLRWSCEKQQTLYVDLHVLMTDEKGELRREFSQDGLHVRPAAYEVWEKALIQVLQQR